jgi:hypothetical protein
LLNDSNHYPFPTLSAAEAWLLDQATSVMRREDRDGAALAARVAAMEDAREDARSATQRESRADEPALDNILETAKQYLRPSLQYIADTRFVGNSLRKSAGRSHTYEGSRRQLATKLTNSYEARVVEYINEAQTVVVEVAGKRHIPDYPKLAKGYLLDWKKFHGIERTCQAIQQSSVCDEGKQVLDLYMRGRTPAQLARRFGPHITHQQLVDWCREVGLGV